MAQAADCQGTTKYCQSPGLQYACESRALGEHLLCRRAGHACRTTSTSNNPRPHIVHDFGPSEVRLLGKSSHLEHGTSAALGLCGSLSTQCYPRSVILVVLVVCVTWSAIGVRVHVGVE
jgi:hypothetical protein